MRYVRGHRRPLAGQRAGDLLGPRAVHVDDDHPAPSSDAARRRATEPARAPVTTGDLARQAPFAHVATVASIPPAIGSSASGLFFSSIIAWPLPSTPCSAN